MVWRDVKGERQKGERAWLVYRKQTHLFAVRAVLHLTPEVDGGPVGDGGECSRDKSIAELNRFEDRICRGALPWQHYRGSGDSVDEPVGSGGDWEWEQNAWVRMGEATSVDLYGVCGST